MPKISPVKTLRHKITWTLVVVLSCGLTLSAQRGTAEQRTATYYESIRKSPLKQMAFLLKMPKGADLHNHLSGSIYAERYIEWAAEKGLCINTRTMTLTVPASPSKCDSEQTPASAALTNSVLYRQMIDAWSMRNWQLSGQSGHDQFFDAFGKFGPATYNNSGRMLAEAVKSAARGNASYIELMLTPDGTPTGVASSEIGQKVGWDGNFETTLSKLKANGIEHAAAIGIKNLQAMEAEKNQLLKCGTPQCDGGNLSDKQRCNTRNFWCQPSSRHLPRVWRAGRAGY